MLLFGGEFKTWGWGMGGIFLLKALKKPLDPAGELNCVYGYLPSLFCSNARAPVAQLARASDLVPKVRILLAPHI